MNRPAAVIDLEEARRLLADSRDMILDPKDPYVSAQELVRLRYMQGDTRTFHTQNGVSYMFDGRCYPETETAAVRADVWEAQANGKRWHTPPGKNADPVLVPCKPTSATVNNMLDALQAITHVPKTQQAPCWLEQKPSDPPASEVTVVQNGILHIPPRRIYPLTPRLFTHNALGFRYDPNRVPEPRLWLQFLREIFDEDAERIAVLQEIMGYLLTPDTRQQKAFLIVGPTRSGKGTIARIIRALLGEANVCGPTLASLSGAFGLQLLIGKLLAVISDARLSSRADPAVIAERLLAISGEDAISVDRKHLPSWTGRLPTRFLILTNELPRLTDASGALASRFVVLTLEQSFLGREDTTLTDRLMVELPGIFGWALDGWDRLQERGHFVQPAASEDAIKTMEDLGSPVAAFVRQQCTIAPGGSIECSRLYGAWKTWCESEGRDHPGTAQTFGRDLRAAVPGLRTANVRTGSGDERARFYEGVTLTGGLISGGYSR
jgi:putative DNA primase/helicase